MKRERFEELKVSLSKDVQQMIDRDESRLFIQDHIIRKITKHGPKDNPSFTARQLTMLFEMAREPRKETEHDDKKRKEK